MVSRRGLLLSSVALSGFSAEVLEALQHAHQAAETGPAHFEYLDPQTAREIESIAAAIIPSGETPGAREAGVIYFIDRALGTFDKGQRELYRTGLADAQRKSRELFPDAASIAALSDSQCISLLRSIESTEFFEALRTHVIIGFMAGPEWGGNRDKAGWKLIGFDDSGAFQPPFGYYDGRGGQE